MGFRYRTLMVAAVVMVVFASACGGGDNPGFFDEVEAGGSPSEGGSGSTEGVAVCDLLSADEIMTAMGFPDDPLPASEATGPSGPFTGCSWGTGWLLVQVAESDRLILPPSDDCPVFDLGDDGRTCPGSVKFFANGVHVSVSTIERHPDTALEAIARLMLPVVERF